MRKTFWTGLLWAFFCFAATRCGGGATDGGGGFEASDADAAIGGSGGADAGAHADVQRRLSAFGVQRALGFSPGRIAALQATEAAIVAVPAALAGLAIGTLAVAGRSGELLAALNERVELGDRELPGCGRARSGCAGSCAHASSASGMLSIRRVVPIRAATSRRAGPSLRLLIGASVSAWRTSR